MSTFDGPTPGDVPAALAMVREKMAERIAADVALNQALTDARREGASTRELAAATDISHMTVWRRTK